MRDRIKYVNHSGEMIEFGKNNILINENDFRDYEWIYSTKNNKISAFNKDTSNKTLPVIVYGKDCKEKANALFEIIEKDVIMEEPGRVYIGDYYLEGYFYASNKSGYTHQNSIDTNLKFVSSQKSWIKESLVSFLASNSSGQSESTDGLDYQYDFPHDYKSDIVKNEIINSSYADAEIEITVYGNCQKPEITIGGHKYSVNCQLETGEYLKINSVTKKIYKVGVDGTITNQFSLRDKDSYIFQKIPSGISTVTWNGLFGFDVTMMERRSEPKWI